MKALILVPGCLWKRRSRWFKATASNQWIGSSVGRAGAPNGARSQCSSPARSAMEKDIMQLTKKYVTETESIETRKGCWNVLKVKIFLVEGDSKTQIGEYDRNYSSMYETFFPFRQGNKEYALYSRSYTATRVMSLPDCKDICGEDPKGNGFCPTGFYVPLVECEEDLGSEYDPDGQFGFVSGCVWGDDHSWKIQYLDLSKISEGILTRDDRFGYIELCGSQNLKDAIDTERWEKDDPVILHGRARVTSHQ